MNLKDRIIIVTAGCSGLGKEFTKFLLSKGAVVIPTTRDKLKASHLNAQIDESVVTNCFPEVLDFEFEEDNQSFIERIKSKFGKVYGLVNVAVFRDPIDGYCAHGIRLWEDHYRVNVFLTTHLTILTAEELIINDGSIVNVSSFYSRIIPDRRIYEDGLDSTAMIYGSSKAALNHITKYLAVEFSSKNIRVNAILPAGTRNQKTQAENFFKDYCYRTPMNRMAAPDEFNSALAFLLSPNNQFCTGQLITVDGGYGLI